MDIRVWRDKIIPNGLTHRRARPKAADIADARCASGHQAAVAMAARADYKSRTAAAFAVAIAGEGKPS
jgi:hypothetical protein